MAFYIPPTQFCQLNLLIINTQGVATASPHVQLVTVPQSVITQYCGSVVGNIAPKSLVLYARFTDGLSKTYTPSWYEGFDGSNHYWFVRLSTGIIANGSYPLYLTIYQTSVIDGVIVGVNAFYATAVLGQAYGWNDNGNNVFFFYQNFAGTSLPPGWASYVGSSSGAVTVNNGVYISSYNSWSFIYTSNIVASPYLSQMVNAGFAVRVLFIDTADCSAWNDRKVFLGYGVTSSTTALDQAYGYYVQQYFGWGNTQSAISYVSGGPTTTIATVSDSDTLNTPMIGYSVWYASSFAWWRYNYTNYSLMKSLSGSNANYSRSQVNEFAISVQSGTTANANSWFYTVALFDAPPNGVMPAVTTLSGAVYQSTVGLY